jgi:hypothetical protein
MPWPLPLGKPVLCERLARHRAAELGAQASRTSRHPRWRVDRRMDVRAHDEALLAVLDRVVQA